jgi:DNA-binding PadR family transcriptional regulator
MAGDDPTAALPLNPREFLILLALAEGPQHGYGILKAVEAESEGAVRFDPANLYRTLRRLERDGVVVEHRTSSGRRDAADSRRRTFALTGAGRQVVRAEARRVERLAKSIRARRLVPKPGGGR